VLKHSDYVLVALAWKREAKPATPVVAHNTNTSNTELLDEGHVENLCTLVVSRIYNVKDWNGKEHMAIYYSLEDGTLIPNDLWELKRVLRKALPSEVLDGGAFACCVPNRVGFRS